VDGRGYAWILEDRARDAEGRGEFKRSAAEFLLRFLADWFGLPRFTSEFKFAGRRGKLNLVKFG
jgi:hypothetical protein